MWFMNGFTVNAVEFLGGIPLSPEQKVKGVGDVNGDGKADIIWQNDNSRIVEVWLMNGASILSTANVAGVPSE
jgi:hypothetical protein